MDLLWVQSTSVDCRLPLFTYMRPIRVSSRCDNNAVHCMFLSMHHSAYIYIHTHIVCELSLMLEYMGGQTELTRDLEPLHQRWNAGRLSSGPVNIISSSTEKWRSTVKLCRGPLGVQGDVPSDLRDWHFRVSPGVGCRPPAGTVWLSITAAALLGQGHSASYWTHIIRMRGYLHRVLLSVSHIRSVEWFGDGLVGFFLFESRNKKKHFDFLNADQRWQQDFGPFWPLCVHS